MGAFELIQQQYPNLAKLLGDPEIGPLLTQAVDPYTGFDANTLNAKIQETNWFRSRSQQGRENEILKLTDPTTYRDQEAGYNAELRAIGAQLGVNLSDAQVLWMTTVGLNAGYSPDSQIMRDSIASLIDPGAVMSGQGSPGAAKDQVEAIARGQWFTQPNVSSLVWEGTNVATGKQSLESLNASLRSWSWNAYPHLREQLAEGQSMADIFNPYRAIIADELEMGSLEQVDMNNPEWRQLLQWKDPKDGTLRLPTASEVQTMARNRPQWWQTSKGREADAGATRSLLQIFGQVR